jgi:hypothetical protein
VVITTRDKLVFVAESFPLDLGRKLADLVLDAQGSGELRFASRPRCKAVPADPGIDTDQFKPITADLTHLFLTCGVMKAAVEAAVHPEK